MVYVDPKDLGYKPYWQKWLADRNNLVEQDELIKLFKKFVPSSIDLICSGVRDGKQAEKLKTIVPLTNLNMASGSCSIAVVVVVVAVIVVVVVVVIIIIIVAVVY